MLENENRGATFIDRNKGSEKRTRHIELTHQFIQQRSQKGQVQIVHVGMGNLCADVFTKALAKDVC